MKNSHKTLGLRTITSIALLVFVSLISGACRENRDTSSDTIIFIHRIDDANEVKTLEKIVEKFRGEFGIKVELSYFDMREEPGKLFAMLKSKEAPDVIEISSEWLAAAVDEGILSALDSSFYDMKNFYKIGTESCFYNGKLYCLPWLINTEALFVEPDILKKCGISDYSSKTIEELNNNCLKVEETGKYYGCGAVASDKNNLFKVLLPFIWAFGGEEIGSDGTITVNSRNNVTALYNYINIARSGLVDTQRELESQFIQGKSVYCFAPLSFADRIDREEPVLKYLISEFPGRYKNNEFHVSGVTPETDNRTYSEVLCLAVNSHSKKIKMCNEFIKYLVEWKKTREFAGKFVESGFPAAKSFVNSQQSLVNSRQSVENYFQKQVLNSKTAPVHRYWFDIEKIIASEVDKAVYAEKSPEEALNAAQERILNFLKSVNKRK